MADVANVFNRAENLEASPQFQPYSKVVIHVSDEESIVEGNDSGRTLEFDNPFGTRQMAQAILASLSGYQYQSYYATGALLDPAAEIGDGVNMWNTYGGIYTRSRTFGSLMKADISAPHDEEINHEYQFESPQERKFTRQINDVKASLIVANDRIDASVSQTGGAQSSFGWSLTSNAHRWYANGKEVMSVTEDGLTVKGTVEADKGKIGGFTISASAIYNNISEFGGKQSYGVYVGTNGIQLGQNFKVTTSGKVTANDVEATSMKLWGNLYFWNGSEYVAFSANSLRIGAKSSFDNGSTWSTGSGYGYNYKAAQAKNSTGRPPWFSAYNLQAQSGFFVGNTQYKLCSRIVKNAAGANITINYLGADWS